MFSDGEMGTVFKEEVAFEFSLERKIKYRYIRVGREREKMGMQVLLRVGQYMTVLLFTFLNRHQAL